MSKPNGNAKPLMAIVQGTKIEDSEQQRIASKMMATLTVSWVEKAFRAGYASNSMNDQIELDQSWEEFKTIHSKTITL